MAPPPPPHLSEELVEEILLRVSPNDRASLVRATLVCRLWRRIASAAVFCRRYLEFHRTAPMLGILSRGGLDESNAHDDEVFDDTAPMMGNLYYGNPLYYSPEEYFDDGYEDDDAEDRRLPTASFVSTSSFRPASADHYGYRVIDVRHGRVLLRREPSRLSGPCRRRINLTVWDPITDEQRQLPSLATHGAWNAAVMCAAGSGCDHFDCHRGSFQVVVVVMELMHEYGRMFTLIYASETNAWSEVASTDHDPYNQFEIASGILLGNALYFLAYENLGIVKYDMVAREISTTNLESKFRFEWIVLMTTEDGRLGLATTNNASSWCKLIQLWSSEEDDGFDGVARFVLSGVIDLEKLLLDDSHKDYPNVTGFADGASRVLFISTWQGLYSIDIQSQQVKKMPTNAYQCVFPYSSFHTPALGAGSAGGPRAGSSSNA